MRDLQIA